MTSEEPGSEIGAEMAAALSAASVALRQTDPAYADKLVNGARVVSFLSITFTQFSLSWLVP